MVFSIVIVFHMVFFLVDFYALYYDLYHVELGTGGLGGKYKYLTVWNITFQCFYFGLCILVDLFHQNTDLAPSSTRTKLQKWRDYFHVSVAFPVGMFVVISFWAIYFVDRELVYPKALDEIIPPFINHVLHTMVLPFIVIDKYLTYHQCPSRSKGLAGTVAVAGSYLAWILFIAYYENFWVYPVLRVLQTYERAIFIFVCMLFFTGLYILGEKLTFYFWSKQLRVRRKIQ